MKKKLQTKSIKVHYNRDIYEYTLGNHKVLIKSPNGTCALYDKNRVKGEARPNFLKRLLRIGQRNIKVTHVDVEKFIAKHY
jgi:hypothetical protein